MKALTPVVPVSDFLKEPDVFANLSESPIILTLRGRPRAVLMDIDAYHEIVQLQQTLEGARTAFDALLLQQTADTSDDEYLPFDALLQQHEELFGEKLNLNGYAQGAEE